LLRADPSKDTLILFAAEVDETVEILLPTNLMDDGYSWHLNWLYADPWNSNKNQRWFDVYYAEEGYTYRQEFVHKDDYISADFASIGRKRNELDTTGKTIDWDFEDTDATDTYILPPYNNCGAKYDVLSGAGGGCNDEMTEGDPALFNNAEYLYNETTERGHFYTQPDYPPFDTF